MLKKTNFEGRSKTERNDCVVRAFTMATGKPYQEIYTMFEKAGRKRNCGTPTSISWPIAEQLGFERIMLPKPMTFKKFAEIAPDEIIVGRIARHAFAMRKNEVLDYGGIKGGSRVTWYFRKKPTPQIVYDMTPKGQYLLPL